LKILVDALEKCSIALQKTLSYLDYSDIVFMGFDALLCPEIE
jgi:hypothetical protein